MRIFDLITSYKPSNASESRSKISMLRFMREYDNNFSREQKGGHFTASSFVVSNDEKKFLLIKHKKIGIWMQPGGHCDGDENLFNVSIKEAKEESGINNIIALSECIFDIDVHEVPEHKSVEKHFHYDVRFLLKALDDDLTINENEVTDIKWAPFTSDLSNFQLNKSVLRMVNKFMRLSK